MYLINQERTLALSIVFTCLATLLVVLRLFTRRNVDKRQKKNSPTPLVYGNHLDDVFCFLALLAVIPTSVVIAWGAAKGAVGGHSQASDAEGWLTNATPEWVTLAEVVWIVLFLQPIALGFIKLSALFFYRRIFIGKTFNILSWVLIGITSGWMVAFFFGLFFDCGKNISANWGSLNEISEQCSFGFLPTIIYTILDAVLDLSILFFPIPWVFSIQMSMQKKLSVVACLMLGGFAAAAALVRMTIFIQSGIPSAATDKGTVVGYPVYDVVGIVSAEMFWTMVESTVALMAICLPTLKKVFKLSNLSKRLAFTSKFGSGHGDYTNKSSSKWSVKDTTLMDIELGRKHSQGSTTYLQESTYLCEAGKGTEFDDECADSEIHKAQEVTVIVCTPHRSLGN